jgi:hypothetical protein
MSRNPPLTPTGVYPQHAPCLRTLYFAPYYSGDQGSAVTWEEVYDRVSDSVVFALREESTVRGAIDILLVFARDTGVGLRVLQHPAWPQVLNEVMGPHAIPECAQVVSLAMQELQAYGKYVPPLPPSFSLTLCIVCLTFPSLVLVLVHNGSLVLSSRVCLRLCIVWSHERGLLLLVYQILISALFRKE